ncbi:MAG: SemiSWEET family transporter [Actinomycetota bacterium]
METVLAYVATGYGIVMALSPVLQIRRMLRLRSSDDVSIAYLAVITVGFVVWVAYGLSIGVAALVVANATAFVVGVATIAVALRFRDRTAPRA